MDYKFETRCIHRDNEHEEGHPYGSVCTPIKREQPNQNGVRGYSDFS